MAINQVSFPTPQAFSGGVDFSPLANLGNVVRQGQQQAAQQQALAQLGPDPVANSQFLIKSGVPELVQAGVRMQGQQATNAEDIRQFNAQQQVREQQLGLAKERAEADTPEYRTKQQQQAIAAGQLPPESMSDPAWSSWRMTGQNIPSAAIVAPQTAMDRKAIRDADQQVESIGQSIDQIDRMKENIDKAFHLGPLTGPVGYAASFLPEGYGGTAGKATEMISNEALRQMIGQIKASFGSNPSNKEDAWLLKAQASVDKAPDVQKQILQEGRDLLVERQRYARDQAAELRGGTYYGKTHKDFTTPTATPAAPAGSAGTTAASPAAPAATTAATPTLGDFMKVARQHNPGVSDSELAAYWKKKYGGGPATETAAAPTPPISR
jgi:hypothetical protein